MIHISSVIKKALLLSSLITFSSSISFSQNSNGFQWCGTDQKMMERRNNPSYKSVLDQDEVIRDKEEKWGVNHQKGIVYRIPIVFHILHNDGAENVSEEQIMNALEVINRDFRKQNADTAEVIPQFQSIIGDVELEFVLAKRAPDGSCFRGYTRTKSPLTFAGDDGGNQVATVQYFNDVYQGNWPSNKYLNVYVVANAGGAGGYTNYPSNYNFGDMTNGIWILHTQFGEIGTSGLSAGRSLTHEIGHWFNLKHTWGDSNTPNEPSNCFTDDNVADTPNCVGNSGGCQLGQNTCSGLIANVQNYMDYALSCQSMFTIGQVTRMRNAVVSSIGGRNNLWTLSNLADVGADEEILCKADFKASNRTVCIGEVVTFTDLSFDNVASRTWTFEGGSPNTSTLQSPSVVFSTPGTYEVSLTATDGVSSVTENRIAYIQVLSPPSQLPFYEGFENYPSLAATNNWFVENGQSNESWEITTSAAKTGLKSVRVNNYNQLADNTNELISSAVDLSNASSDSVTMSFRYAYRKMENSNFEFLKVYFSSDCGATWVSKKTIAGPLLGNVVAYNSWAPVNSDWNTVHITSVAFTNAYMNENFRYKFRFESDGGNNIYIDDINIYEGSSSNTIVLNTDELHNDFSFDVFPNPATKELNIHFISENSNQYNFEIRDLSGKLIHSKNSTSTIGKNEYSLQIEELASGMYLLNITDGVSSRTVQFIKE